MTSMPAAIEAVGNPSPSTTSHESPDGGAADRDPDPHMIPKPKRLACMICRKRKLRCDGGKPRCSTCTRLGHTCAYDEARKKSGPKRGYVKALEERLKQVETLLQTQEPAGSRTGSSTQYKSQPQSQSQTQAQPQSQSQSQSQSQPQSKSQSQSQHQSQSQSRCQGQPSTTESPIQLIPSDKDGDQRNTKSPGSLENFNFNANIMSPATSDLPRVTGMPEIPEMPEVGDAPSSSFRQELLQLGIQEPLPPQNVIDELHDIFFQKISPTCPIIHKFRYLTALSLAPSQRPPLCLRYAMWTLACSLTDQVHHRDIFYERARRYLELDYLRGHGGHMVSVAHAQTHILLAKYELKMMFFPRAWMSTGSGVRLCQMLGLHRLDGAGLDVKQCIGPPRDWTEKEERRRTFWMAFCEDRYASIGTGWPMIIDERDILTNLPSSDEAFEASRQETTMLLQDAMNPSGAAKLSSFGGIILMACLFGKNLVHLHRPDSDNRNHDLNGEFWKRHRHLDNILLNTSLCLPSHLKLPNGLQDPNAVFLNMCIHTSTICLHQAAIFTSDKHSLPASVSSESKIRCISAANEIASIMRMVSHMDLAIMNPFLSFCLYVAARVVVQYLKSVPDDLKIIDSLRFLLSAMNALKSRNPLTESFITQLDVDLEAMGMMIPKLRSLFPHTGEVSHVQKMAGWVEQTKKYRNECHFMKVAGDDGNLATAPDIGPINETPRPQQQQQQRDPAVGGGSLGTGTKGFNVTNSWSSGDQQGLAKRKDPSGNSQESMPMNLAGGFGIAMEPTAATITNLFENSTASDSLDQSVSPVNEPTPGSSGGSSEQLIRNGKAGGSHNNTTNLTPGGGGHMNASGSNSFAPSPIIGNHSQNMVATTEADLFRFGLGAQPGIGTTAQRFSMGDHGEMSTTQAGGDNFISSVPAGPPWEVTLEGQQESPVMGEGSLRHFLAMGSLEMMDMAWDAGS